MKLYLLFSVIVFCSLWAMINDDHLPEITPSPAFLATMEETNTESSPLSENQILGEKLFKNHCNTCHNLNMVDDMTGPALKGVTERWADYPKEDLYNWIRNSQKMIQTGHPKATALFKDWNKIAMTSFDLTDEEIGALLEYIELY